jgi:hypothetical protein
LSHTAVNVVPAQIKRFGLAEYFTPATEFQFARVVEEFDPPPSLGFRDCQMSHLEG